MFVLHGEPRVSISPEAYTLPDYQNLIGTLMLDTHQSRVTFSYAVEYALGETDKNIVPKPLSTTILLEQPTVWNQR